MSPSAQHLLRLTAAGALCAAALGCELDPNCDPDVDENCDPVIDTADAGAVTDTGGGGNTDTGGTTSAVYRYVYIIDFGGGGGSHPGADIDAVEVVSGGQSRWATAVTDRYFEPGVSNAADDPTQTLGPPATTGSAHSCDVSAAIPHWYSLGPAGFIVLDTGAAGIQDGDELIVYECAGVPDPYIVSIGPTARVDDPEAQYETVMDEVVGYTRVVIDFDALGIR